MKSKPFNERANNNLLQSPAYRYSDKAKTEDLYFTRVIMAALRSRCGPYILVHGQVTIIFVVSACLSMSVCLSDCLCRLFLSRL